MSRARGIPFLRDNFVGVEGLNVKIKSSGGASVNIDGPFEIAEFEWKEFDERHTVLQPTWAKKREKSAETNVHLHVPWDRMSVCRIQYTEISRLIPQECKIAFFEHQPPPASPGDSILWFYAFLNHPLVQKHPNTGNGYSQAFALESVQLP